MLNRYICDVIEDMRKMYATRNFSGFLGSVEEIQSMASRMENKLSDYREVDDIHKAYKKLKKEFDKAYDEYAAFVDEINKGRKNHVDKDGNPHKQMDKISRNDFKYNTEDESDIFKMLGLK